jgi:hypothetical protein
MGAVIYTNTADFEGWTWDPEDSIDYSVPGAAALAAGYQQARGRVRGQHPDAGGGSWTQWVIEGKQPMGMSIYARLRVADTEEGLDVAAWSRYLGGWNYLVDEETGKVDFDKGYGFVTHNVGVEILNMELAQEGPWYELEVTLRK